MAFCLIIPTSLLIGATTDNFSGLAITLQSDKQQYILGEPVSLTFKVMNNSNTWIELPGLIDVFAGQLVPRIALENGPYREYRGPGWGSVNRRFSQPLDAGGSIEITAAIAKNRAAIERFRKAGTLKE